MGTYAWNTFYSKILPAKSCTRRRRPATQGPPSQAVDRNLATDRKCFYIFFLLQQVTKIHTDTHTNALVTWIGASCGIQSHFTSSTVYPAGMFPRILFTYSLVKCLHKASPHVSDIPMSYFMQKVSFIYQSFQYIRHTLLSIYLTSPCSILCYTNCLWYTILFHNSMLWILLRPS